MLQVKIGDLFDNAEPGSIIMHGCNCVGVMKSGFALEIKTRFPEAFIGYTDYCDKVGLGRTVFVATKGFIIANAITQPRYGYDKQCYVSYLAVHDVVKEVAEYAAGCGQGIHLPFIGADRGGGDPEQLMEIFETGFRNVNATLWKLK